jgi:hypothetical protein
VSEPMPEGRSRSRTVATAWDNWLLLFIPLSVVTAVMSNWFGESLIYALLICLLAGVLLYQRFVNRRSWRSILWGVHASGD